MQSVQAGMWDPRPPSKHASPLPQPAPHPSLRPTHVITATPAKRITFYKSGDNQFGGIRMAVHKRSFKCFDALLDDLSQKMPLPFGVRTVTTPRGTHTIKHLEQLQDGGCYLCSDRRQAKPVNMELASRRPNVWYHHGQRPHRPETSSATPNGHLPYRQRRILLVKNSEPGVRRSVVLSRRLARSLRAFLDEASEVMQFHVRKLYTAEGRRIDSVQSLMTCPGVLVCVGREAFSPMLVNFIRKSSEERLPGLGSRSAGLGPRTPGNGARSPATQGVRSPPHGAQSRASEYSEGHESKKNVNFGLETKKSIIHPRSDSSTRSARFSLSSEKSYGNGVSTDSQARPTLMNEDIEKRVLVNKDGSLSVEMRVRFRLQNDETLQWSTQIKKSPSLTNDCCSLSQAQPHYLQQGQSESCSDPDSTSFDPESGDYSSQPLQHVLEGNHCPCCYQRQEQQYDFWENPAHSLKQPPVPPPHSSGHTHSIVRQTHSSSSSSSCNSRRVVRCRARLANGGRSSGLEQSQLVQEAMCMTEQVEHRVEVEQNGDTHVEVCRVSRCCSRSEVVTMDSNHRPLSQKSVEDELMMEEGEERPLSAISSSSHVLQSLNDDQDDDLPPSASQCSHRNEPSPTCEAHPMSTNSNGSVHGNEGRSRAVSAISSCHCGTATPHSTAEAEEMDGTPSSKIRMSQASCRSSRANNQASEEEGVGDDVDEEIKRAVSGFSSHTGLSEASLQSGASSVCLKCGGCKRKVSSVSNSRASQRSHHSQGASPKPTENADNCSDDDGGSNASAQSTHSNKSNLTNRGCCSAVSNGLEGRAPSAMSATEGERAPSATSATSHKSDRSCKSGYGGTAEDSDSGVREDTEGAAERALSSLSAKSAVSSKTNASVKLSIVVASPTDNTTMEEDDSDKRPASALSAKSNVSNEPGKAERPDSAVSAKSVKSNMSLKSGKSHRSTCSRCARAVSPGADEHAVEATQQEEGTEPNGRALSTMSSKSNKSSKASDRSRSPRSEAGGENRVLSQMSGRSVKSNTSGKAEEKESAMVEEETQQRAESGMSAKLENEERAASAGSCKSNCNENPGAGSKVEHDTGDGEEDQERAASVLSGKSASSAKSHHSRGASDKAKTEVNSTEERAPSAVSGKSHGSAKSSRSQMSNRSAVELSPETNRGENQTQERVASAQSVKSKSSVRSSTSHKTNSSRKVPSASPSANVITIKTPEVVGEGGNDTTERALSSASTRSGKSNVSAASRKSRNNAAADADNRPTSKSSEHSPSQMLSPRGAASPQSHSPKAQATPPSSPQPPAQQLSPGLGVGGTRGPSALSVHSIKSAKSARSKCCCGATSAKKEPEKHDEEPHGEEGASVLSSSTRRTRRESGGTEHPLSRNSSGSVSLGLPEDTADSDSGKSSVSFQANSERVKPGTADAPNDQEVSGPKEDEEGSENDHGSTVSQNAPAVKIPTIETPRGSDGKDEEAGNTKVPDSRASPTTSSASAKIRSKSPANQAVSRPASKAKAEDVTASKAASTHSKSPCCLRPESAASVPSDSQNPIKDTKAKSSGSVKTSASQKIKSSSPCPSPNSRRGSKVETCSESTLSHSLSAADLLKETMAVARPHGQQSKASRTSDKSRSEKSRRSKNQVHQEELELTPACLPNASPSEVISDWLRSIPAHSNMLALGDELHQEEEKEVEENPREEAAKEESPENERVDPEEKAEVEEEGEKEEEGDGAAAEKTSLDPVPGDTVTPSYPRTLLLSDGSLPRNWQSSAAVMKVLLSSSLGRCQSMPEVSPSYGRRLSTSAREFLDCLAQLQLIEPAVNPGCEQQKDRKYEDIMAILQSLWLTEPKDIEAKEAKEGGTEQVTPPRSSSGVDMSSGSGGSGKENGNQGGDETEQNQTHDAESLHEDGGAEKLVEEEVVKAEPEETEQNTLPTSLDSPKTTENPSSSEKSSANDSSKSPTDNEQETPEDSSSDTPPTVLRAPLSKKLSQDPDPVWILHLLKKLEKQFMNHYITAMAEFKVRWDLDDSVILDTMISELRDEVSRRIQSSIDREMKKIQSRAGRAGRSPKPPKGANLSRESTMTEKRRRMLRVMKNQSVKTADSLSDGEMTGDFSDQRSDDEYCPCDACVRKKMAARPLKTNPLAAEAPVMMEFDLLKILQLKKSPSPSAKPQPLEEEGDSLVVEEEGRNLAVVQEEEEEEETKEDIQADVILEETIPEEDEAENEENGDGTGTEMEEEGETGGEEACEEETSENGEEEGEEETQCRCQCASNDEEEEEGSDKAEEADEEGKEPAAGEEETGGGEGETADDEEKGGKGAGESADDEEEARGSEGETGSGGEEEGSDKETVKEATTGDEQTAENAEEEEDECEVTEFKQEEEEETTGKESREEEASGETEDHNAANNEGNEESTLVEEITEGNASTSAEAEDEDEGDEESHEEAEGEVSEDQEKEASEGEGGSQQGQGVTEGEEADVEDSDTDAKRPSDTSADESGHDGIETVEDEEAQKSGGDEEVGDAAEQSKPEEEEEEVEGEVNSDKKEDSALLHQVTRTSVESQPGSLEDIDTDSPQTPVSAIEVPKMGAGVSLGGGTGPRRTRSPARVKRRKPKECDVELGDI